MYVFAWVLLGLAQTNRFVEIFFHAVEMFFPSRLLLLQFGSLLAPFWLHFGHFGLPLGSLSAPLGSLSRPFGTFLVHFLLHLTHFWLLLCSFGSLLVTLWHLLFVFKISALFFVYFLWLCMNFDDSLPKTVLFRFTSRPLFLNVPSLCFCCVFVDTLLCRNSAAYR